LTVVIEGVRDGESGKVDAGGFGFAGILQHVLRS
jgi:hypothetical protein